MGSRVNLALGACLFGPAALLGQQLIEKTHHRPLGAATFASAVVLMWVFVVGLARVLSVWSMHDPSLARRAQRWLLLFGLGLSAAALTPVFMALNH